MDVLFALGRLPGPGRLPAGREHTGKRLGPIHRPGDGGINFSTFLGGEEYTGTGSGEADEIADTGFSCTGTMVTPAKAWMPFST